MSNNYNYSTFDSNYDTFRETDPIFPKNTKTRKLNTEPIVKLCQTSANGLKSLIKYVSNKIYQKHDYKEVYDFEVDEQDPNQYIYNGTIKSSIRTNP